jgi:hypothetical protein
VASKFKPRSVNPNSLSIWTHNLKSIEWFEGSFTPKGCNHSIEGTAMRVGSGGQWRDLNAAAAARKVVLVGGEFDTVSVGGFLANGGHGGLSAKWVNNGALLLLYADLLSKDTVWELIWCWRLSW